MKTGIGHSTAKSAADVARGVARMVAAEPAEILREVKEQVTGENPQVPGDGPKPTETDANRGRQEYESRDNARSQRMLGALQKEIDDIRRQDLFKTLQARIAEGESLPLENYSELTMDQKQILKAEEQAVMVRIQKERAENLTEVPAIHSKPSRRFGAGQKHEAEKQQTRVEKPIPPSG